MSPTSGECADSAPSISRPVCQFSAVLLDENKSALRHYAAQRGLVDQVDAISELAQSIVPGPASGASTPAAPVCVEFTITGPDAAELEASIRA